MKDTGGSAFPQSFATDKNGGMYTASDKYGAEAGGMTLRDYFAGQALAGIAACLPPNSNYWTGDPPTEIVKQAYKLADAMLAQKE